MRHPALMRLVEALPHELEWPLHDLLAEELPESDRIIWVQCGEESETALLHVPDEWLTFYSVDHPDGKQGRVRTVRIAPPKGARVSEERLVRFEKPGGKSWLATSVLKAEHESLPGGWIECDCARLEEAAIPSIRELFQSWVAIEVAGS